jgi:ribosomal protein S18 acetylase RimI-like enzyme
VRDLRIRTATISDKGIVRYLGETAPRHKLKSGQLSTPLAEGWIKLAVHPNTLVVGYMLSPEGDEYLDSVVVDPRYRGEGVGTKLVRHHLSLSEATNGYLVSRTYAPDESVGFLKKLGYVVRYQVEGFYDDGGSATFMEIAG